MIPLALSSLVHKISDFQKKWLGTKPYYCGWDAPILFAYYGFISI